MSTDIFRTPLATHGRRPNPCRRHRRPRRHPGRHAGRFETTLESLPQGASPAEPRGGYVLERDAEVAREEAGTHRGGGQTVGYSFFRDTPGLAMVFRKRALKPGAAIGYHEQHEDEIYYVLSGPD